MGKSVFPTPCLTMFCVNEMWILHGMLVLLLRSLSLSVPFMGSRSTDESI